MFLQVSVILITSVAGEGGGSVHLGTDHPPLEHGHDLTPCPEEPGRKDQMKDRSGRMTHHPSPRKGNRDGVISS